MNIKSNMGKGFKWLAVAALSVVLVLLFVRGKEPNNYFELSKNLEVYADIFKELNIYYVDPVEPGKLMKTGVDAMLDELDPYTNYITESDMEDYEFQTTGKYGGIGATMHKKDEDVVVGDVYENSPAQKAGLHPGDIIYAIDNNPIKGKSTDDLSSLLKGAPGTQVVLKVKDVYNNTVSEKIVTRGEIELSSVPYAGLVGTEKNVAYVRLTQFTPACSRLVRNALDSIKAAHPNIKGVVLDLRNNPGGLLDEAVNVCNLFIDRGQLVVSTHGKMSDWDNNFNTHGAAWDTQIPLTVLVNHSSASASEIVAGTMQDLDRGVIIGERSYGKGLVQTTRQLQYNAKLKVTVAKYYTPSGRCIQALDYTHRNPDGSVGNIPDSLKKAYKTKNGRKVLSGGGVEPDVYVKEDPISKISITLYSKNYFFDYATQYTKQHKTISDPGSFSLSTAEFNDFAKWLEGKDYSYKTETEEMFDTLKSTAIKEKYYEGAKTEFAALQTKISHDKKQDLLKHQPEVARLLENEIVSRYYYLRGRIAQSLQDDNDLNTAVSIISDGNRYKGILTTK